MFRLSREIRIGVNANDEAQLADRPSNSYGGYPSLTGAGSYLTLSVTLNGEIDPHTGYLCNIKDIDQAVRARAIPLLSAQIRRAAAGQRTAPSQWPALLLEQLQDAWAPAQLSALSLALSPFLSVGILAREAPMTRLSHKFEFSASHRLHNADLSDAENRRVYGKCNNPHGHGHNYELQVTLSGQPRPDGMLVDIPTLERIVTATVLDRLDHKNLNVEVAEFAQVNPSVENIAKVIYQLLSNKIPGAALASVTVWETPRTWCEYAP